MANVIHLHALLTLILLSHFPVPSIQLSRSDEQCIFTCAGNPSSSNCACIEDIPASEDLMKLFRWKRDEDNKPMFRWGKRQSSPLGLLLGLSHDLDERSLEFNRQKSADSMFRWGKRGADMSAEDYNARNKKSAGMFRWGKRHIEPTEPLYPTSDEKRAEMFRWGKRLPEELSPLSRVSKREDSMFRWGKRAWRGNQRKDTMDRRRIFMWGKRSSPSTIDLASKPGTSHSSGWSAKDLFLMTRKRRDAALTYDDQLD